MKPLIGRQSVLRQNELRDFFTDGIDRAFSKTTKLSNGRLVAVVWFELITDMPNKILIVDDNADLLTVLRLGFSKAGFVVRTSDNGVEAIKKARSFEPDLILLDLIMPEMDGFAVCESLKKNQATAEIPVVVLTGLSSQLSRFAGLESGADEYLTKPFNFNEILDKVKDVLERKAAAAPPVVDYAHA